MQMRSEINRRDILRLANWRSF